jgi:F420H(2)-dependent biliverdin reductase
MTVMTHGADTYPTAAVEERLRSDANVWMATVRPDGRAHLVPIWFVWEEGKFWICTGSTSVKVRNLQANPSISISLESGNDPVIAEGLAQFVSVVPPSVRAEFVRKYQWEIAEDADYGTVFCVNPHKWIRWNA